MLNHEKKDATLPKTNGLPLKNGGKGRLSPSFRDRSWEGNSDDGSFGVSSHEIPILRTIH